MKKRFFAGICGLVMVTAAAPLSVFAVGEYEENNAVGKGRLEGVLASNVFKVEVPTDTPDGYFDYILDPNEMIAKTDGARYPDEIFEPNATLFFANRDISEFTFSNESDKIELINKSSDSVDVNVKISVASDYDGKIVFNEDSSFDGDTDTSMYMAILSELDDREEAISPDTGEAVIDDVSIEGVDAEALNVTWDKENKKYITSVNTTDPNLKKAFSFKLKGASNSKGKWVEDMKAPDINIIWRLSEQVGDVAPSVKTNGVVTISAGATEDKILEFDLGNGELAATGITSVMYGNTVLSKQFALINPASDGKVTVTVYKAFWDKMIDTNTENGLITVTFDDPDETSLEVPFEIT